MSLMLKDPAAELDYEIDWGRDYLDDDVLFASDWSVVPVEEGGIEVVASSFDTRSSRVKVAGGLAGRVYRLTNMVMTDGARRDRRSLTVRVEAR